MPTSSGPYREDREMTDNGIGGCARVGKGTDEAPHAQGARQEHVRAALLIRRHDTKTDEESREERSAGEMSDETTYEDRPTGAAKHGNYFFGVNERDHIVMFYADKVTVEPGGVLCAYRKRDDEWQMTLAWVPGEWSKFWAASIIDGNAIAIDSIHPYPSKGETAKKPAKKRGAQAKR